ncbi:nuclear transport factor 2 family protein [Flavobacterium aquidurense]|uniref:nuclear transport factor 2 family protein n=1 Tax=Flavobacterium aquidurense TaxID=362413 RepID=UPI003757D28E
MKKIILFGIAFLVISCNNQNQSKIMETTKNEKLIKQYFEYFNKHDWKKMSEMYTETADFKDPSLALGPGIIKQTRKQIEDKYAELNNIFPDLHDKVIQVYPSGEKHIIVEFVSTGTAPDNSKFELPICTIFTIENGLITKDFTYFDNFEEGE